MPGDAGEEDDVARITLEFDMPEDDFRAALGTDGDGRDTGITAESIAAYAIRRHAPEDGYILWSIQR